MIDRATIDRIKDAADIQDVVSEFVSLKRVGSNYRGLCPFHNDRTPSFYVSPARGLCHCFTCGEGGDAVSFLMKHEQYTYPEALRWLANRYGIYIEEEELTPEQRQKESDRESMFVINEWAANYFKDILHNDIDGRAIGMQYFRSRGFRDDIIERFKLGFSLSDNKALARKAKEGGYSTEYLVKTGICYKRDDGTLIDRFAGRAIFPWIGISGKVVAFGGRVLDSRTKGVDQKYVNSPDSDIYHKDHELYGIFQAKKAIGKENCVYMVEGYTDVISMHQCGLENVVANSGTALSVHQIRILHRFTSNIVLLYDGDAAGIHAALRGTDMLLQDGMNVKVLLLPDGDDPDSFARKHTAADFKQYIEEHKTDFIEFKTRVLLQGVTDPIKRSEAINSIIKSISVISDPIVRATYIKDCSSRLGIQENTLLSTMNNFIRNYRDEKRKEEERERRKAQASQVAQASSATSAGSPGSQYAPANNTAPSTTPSTTPSSAPQASGDPYDDIPPEAFLPPEAFEPAESQPSAQGVTTTSQSQSQPTAYQGSQLQTTTNKNALNSVQDLLMRAIAKYGERVIYDEIETENGDKISFNVAQYVDYDLGSDKLSFKNPIYNQMLTELVSQSDKEDFSAENYLIKHPDYEISRMGYLLTIDNVQLSKSMQKEMTQEELREHINHLILDFRKEYVDEKLASLRTEIGLSANDHNKMLSLMGEYQKFQLVRNALAKKLGTNVFAK